MAGHAYDVVVAGGGIAGSTVAGVPARAGFAGPFGILHARLTKDFQRPGLRVVKKVKQAIVA